MLSPADVRPEQLVLLEQPEPVPAELLEHILSSELPLSLPVLDHQTGTAGYPPSEPVPELPVQEPAFQKQTGKPVRSEKSDEM
jgi:hypothetical protein